MSERMDSKEAIKLLRDLFDESCTVQYSMESGRRAAATVGSFDIRHGMKEFSVYFYGEYFDAVFMGYKEDNVTAIWEVLYGEKPE